MNIHIPRSIMRELLVQLSMDSFQKSFKIMSPYGWVTFVSVDDDEFLEEIPTTKKVWKNHIQGKGD